MLYGGGALALVQLALLVYCVLNVVTTPAAQVRSLPKPLWLMVVVVLPVVGAVAWLVAGRPQGPARRASLRGGRASASSPDDDEAFLRSLRERAEEQRRRAEQQRRTEDDAPG